MQWHNLTFNRFTKVKDKIIDFFKQHGDKRITRDGINWIKQATPESFETPGTLVLCVVDQKVLVGVVIVANYGIEESFIAVHKRYRNQDIGNKMVEYVVSSLGKIYGRIAMDNIPSIKICLENGMVAFHLFEGPTGKPTLWLGGGNWNKADVL